MALRWLEGFDWLGTLGGSTDLAHFYTVSGGPGASASRVRTGVSGMSGSAAASAWYIEKQVTLSGSVIAGFGYAHNSTGGTNGRSVFAIVEGSTIHLSVRINGSRQVEVYRGDVATGTLLATSTATVPNDAYAYVEIEASINDSTGHVKVWIDDALDINISSQDTQNGGTGVPDRFRLGKLSHAGSSDFEVDDFYILDSSGAELNARLTSAVRIDCLTPSGAGSSTQWTPSAGSNYQCVDDTPPNEDTDYVSAGSTGLIDLYAMGDLPVSPAAIKAVMVGMVARKDDAGPNEIRTKLKSGSTTQDGATRTLTTSYAGFADIYTTDPDTSNSWSESGVNAIEAGVERVT